MKGHVYQRTKGSWTIMYDLPPDGTGKRKQKSETFKGITKKQAEQKLRDKLTALDNGSYIPVARETVGAFLDKWMETYVATNCTLRTAQGYRQYINGYIMPAIGHVELQKLTPAQIQAIYAALQEKGLSARTVMHLHRILHKALATAVKWQLLARNPVDATTAPPGGAQATGDVGYRDHQPLSGSCPGEPLCRPLCPGRAHWDAAL